MRKYYNSVVRKDNAVFVRFYERNGVGSLDGMIKKTEEKVWWNGTKTQTRYFENQKITADLLWKVEGDGVKFLCKSLVCAKSRLVKMPMMRRFELEGLKQGRG